MRTAIIHYWLVGMRGGERVLERLLRLFPAADVYTHVYDPGSVSDLIAARTIRTTFIDRLPAARTLYKHYLPLMPLALEQLDLSAYDLVISSEAGPAKGVITRPDAVHICYCHSPMRYLWDQYPEYRREVGAITRTVMAPVFHMMRTWDVGSAARVDRFVANSSFVAQRINKFYRRKATVVFPPTPVDQFHPTTDLDPGYLWVGQLTGYKKPQLAVEAFNRLGLPLHVVGDGPLERALRAMAGPNVRFTRRLSFDELKSAYARCRALVFTAEEDFGIVPVEAMAAGRPVVAFGRGGVRDTVIPGTSGLFYDTQTPEALVGAIRAVEAWLPGFDPAAAVKAASRFAPERFDAGFMAVVTEELERVASETAAGVATR